MTTMTTTVFSFWVEPLVQVSVGHSHPFKKQSNISPFLWMCCKSMSPRQLCRRLVYTLWIPKQNVTSCCHCLPQLLFWIHYTQSSTVWEKAKCVNSKKSNGIMWGTYFQYSAVTSSRVLPHQKHLPATSQMWKLCDDDLARWPQAS